MKRRSLLLGAVGGAAAAANMSDARAADGSLQDRLTSTVVDVRHPRFAAKGDGIADDTGAIQAAIDSLARGYGQVYLPNGTYRVTSQLTVAKDRVHLVGAGRHATQILFAPTASGTCIRFSVPGAARPLAECSIRSLQIYSHDSGFTKTALEIVECSQFVLEDVGISGHVWMDRTLMWAGANSVGLRLDGHDAVTINRLYVAANRPIVIGPHWTDHVCFHDLYYIGDTVNPGIEVLDGTELFTNITFSGYQAWVRPATGFKYVDTSATSVNSYSLRFENVRIEQETDSTSWMFDIQHNYLVYNVSFSNCKGGLNQNGWRLRRLRDVSLSDCLYESQKLVVVEAAAAAGYSLTFDNFTCFGGTSVRLGGYRFQRGSWRPIAGQPIPNHAVYVYEDAVDKTASWPLLGAGREYVFNGQLASQSGVDLQCGSAAGVTLAQCVVGSHGKSTNEGGIAFVTPGGSFRIGGTSKFDVGDVTGKLTILKAGGNTILFNRLPETVSYLVRVTCF